MATKLRPSYLLFSFSAVSMLCCWANCVEANPVWAENDNQLDRKEVVFEAGEPLTDEEFNSGVHGKAVSIDDHGTQPWEKQPHSGLVGGDVLPGDQKNANKNADVKWPNAQVPYVISSSFTADERRAIASAMTTYHQKTCIRFVARRTQSDYIKIIRSRESTNGWANYPGCWSQKGRVGGAQELSLDNGCVYASTIVHELMHAVGFNHEQERPDQDKYITVKYDNIDPRNHQWFSPKPADKVNSIGRYDLNSVMHYSSHAFAIDHSRPTMVAKNGRTTMGNPIGLTWMDVQKLRALYCGY